MSLQNQSLVILENCQGLFREPEKEELKWLLKALAEVASWSLSDSGEAKYV